MMVQYFLFALLLTYSVFFKPASLKRDYSSLYLSLTWKFVVFTKHEPSVVSLRFQFRPETQAKNANEVLTGDQNAAFNAGITTRSITTNNASPTKRTTLSIMTSCILPSAVFLYQYAECCSA